jgi:DNA invertase Pin-like site-specific DNA recombinase
LASEPSEQEVAVAALPKHALVYLRVSSSQQADTDYDPDGFSIPAQRQACERRAAELGAVVVERFVDRGESAKTAKRPALQAMLARAKAGGIDYVIVHKIDRLARNRADDVAIVMAIRSAGAQLVSVSENIDETPSGVLLHGIMSSIAEFYSRNLASEILKGATQKAQAGGTLGLAPIGYRNVREVRTVAIDEERASDVQLAFDLYASGNYSLSDLAALMESRGLRKRATRKRPSAPVTASQWQAILRNRYYVCEVRYQGKSYPGRHPRLISDELFARVQSVLDAHRLSGERERRHHHYLKGTLYCGECSGRLIFSRNKGNGGSYDYFLCRGRQRGHCSQRYHRTDVIEEAVERLYAKVELTPAKQATIRALIHQRLDELNMIGEDEISRARRC